VTSSRTKVLRQINTSRSVR